MVITSSGIPLSQIFVEKSVHHDVVGILVLKTTGMSFMRPSIQNAFRLNKLVVFPLMEGETRYLPGADEAVEEVLPLPGAEGLSILES